MNEYYGSLTERKKKFNYIPLLVFIGCYFIEAIFEIAASGIIPESVKMRMGLLMFIGKLAPLIFLLIIYRPRIVGCMKEIKGNGKQYLYMLLIGFGVFFLFEMAASSYQTLMDKIFSIGDSSNQEALISYFTNSKTFLNFFILFLVLVILAPILEELMYRELIFKTFEGLSWWIPLLISTILFASGHIDFTNLTLQEIAYYPLYILPGIGLGLVYHYSKNNFYISTGCHMIINCISFIQIVSLIFNQTGGATI